MIKETGYWTSDDTESIHVHDPRLANWILNYLQDDKDKQLIDFGCGFGDYLKNLHNNGFTNLHGFEGEVRKGSPEFIKNWDLSIFKIFCQLFCQVSSMVLMILK